MSLPFVSYLFSGRLFSERLLGEAKSVSAAIQARGELSEKKDADASCVMSAGSRKFSRARREKKARRGENEPLKHIGRLGRLERGFRAGFRLFGCPSPAPHQRPLESSLSSEKSPTRVASLLMAGSGPLLSLILGRRPSRRISRRRRASSTPSPPEF